MKMKKFFLIAAFLLSALLLSCSHVTENGVDESETGIRILLNIDFSKTVMPSGFVNATYTLTGTHNGESTVLVENKSASDLQTQILWLEGGSWTFTLDAYVNSTKIATSTLSNQTINSS